MKRSELLEKYERITNPTEAAEFIKAATVLANMGVVSKAEVEKLKGPTVYNVKMNIQNAADACARMLLMTCDNYRNGKIDAVELARSAGSFINHYERKRIEEFDSIIL